MSHRPGLVPTLAVLLLLPALTSLGFWQLRRADEKAALQAEYDRRAGDRPVQIEGRLQRADDLRFYRVRAQGRFESERQIYLDNRVHNGVPGYHVLTPLKIQGSDIRVLVNRGWIAGRLNRGDLPEAPVPSGTVTVLGTATVPLKGGFHLGPPILRGGQWQTLWQYLDMDLYAAEAPFKLQPVVILLDPASQAGGLVREWQRLDTGVAVHHGYAFQWFSLAVVLAGIYLFLMLRRPGPKARHGDDWNE